jgi:hypothetical protein
LVISAALATAETKSCLFTGNPFPLDDVT